MTIAGAFHVRSAPAILLQHVLLNPGDDVARFVERFAVDEEARYLAFSAYRYQMSLCRAVGRDITLGDRDAVACKEVLDLDAIGASGHDVKLKLVVCWHGTPIGSDVA